MRSCFRRFPPLFLCALMSSAAHAAELTEQDYFDELPEVLTVTRLAQPLSETPGAVTIIDRDTIRRSGARELVDVLRLVPGYLVGGWTGANPNAAYHVPLDDYGTRNLVLVDGRSVYSAFLLGDTHRGMMGIPLEDVERIEVLRGSNSAAYGANAMFGVINIITRHASDTQGVALAVTSGEGGTQDNYARLGWGTDTASFRVTAARRKDDGYRFAYDDKILSQLHVRGDARPALDQEVFVAAGIVEQSAGDGFPGYLNNGNLERGTNWTDFYLQGAWERQLSSTDKFRVSASFDEENIHDSFPYHLSIAPPAVLQTVTLDFGGRARRWNLEFQHHLGLGEGLRAVWGAGYSHEEAKSHALYYVDGPVSVREYRAFGTLEWRINPRWVVNAGAFLGDHSRKGSYSAPRLMVNYHVGDDHTLRAGWTKSARIPNLYELSADRRYDTVLGQLRYDAATGKVEPEVLKTEEVGYFGNFQDWRLTLDVRAYRERMLGVIDKKRYTLPGYVLGQVDDFVNVRNLETHGIEYQLRWKPWADTEIWLNQSAQRMRWNEDGRQTSMPPERALMLAIFQRLPNDVELTLIYSSTSEMTWRDEFRKLKPVGRTDLRVAYPFRVGTTRMEAALTVQALNGDHVASYPDLSHPQFLQERRAYGTLRLEF
ncbi:MAG: TonB-dependent receptor [Pseudomonadota bacterium]